jgi:inosose dehydratase
VDLGSQLVGAPISWGVCEVPGWGLMLPPERVLGEMASLGLRSTELGPAGYLGDGAAAVLALLRRHDLRLAGGFVPLVLHDRGGRGAAERTATSAASLLAEAGAAVFVTAAVVDEAWSPRGHLDDDEWLTLADGLDMVDDVCEAHGLTQVLHPHVGTVVETADDIEQVLGVADVRWCLDTGHLMLGGVDPVRFAAAHADRVGHVHLKDVNATLAADVRAGRSSLLAATRRGVFRPLGRGDVDIAGVVEHLERAGYAGLYTLEQDTTLDEPPAPGEGPIADVRESVAYLATHVGPTPAGPSPVER